MRNLQSRLIQFDAAKQQKVQVERSGTVANTSPAVAAELQLNGQQRIQQSARLKTGVESNYGVHKAGLVGEPDRFRLVQ